MRMKHENRCPFCFVLVPQRLPHKRIAILNWKGKSPFLIRTTHGEILTLWNFALKNKAFGPTAYAGPKRFDGDVTVKTGEAIRFAQGGAAGFLKPKGT